MSKNIVLGVSGSVAAYRACDLARELMRRGFAVRVCLTDSAEKFVTRSLFEALTGYACLVDTFEEPISGRMAHIDWARQASALVIAPATANTIAKVAHGIGDDMLTTIALAYQGPMLIAPAMNPTMYASETNQAAMAILADRGVWFVEPTVGDVACGENGQGKFADVQRIADEVVALARTSKLLAGKKVLITSGPTQEPIDMARFISNRSSGKMGAALAQAALLMGAEVTVISGPTAVRIPVGVKLIRVKTAVEMLDAGLLEVSEADFVIGAAAVADYRPAQASHSKLRRSDAHLSLELVPNPDVIAALAAKANPGAKVIGFAAEPSQDTGYAIEKMARKGLSAIVFNDVSQPDQGFESDTNRLQFLTPDGKSADSGLLSKTQCALWLIHQVVDSISS